MTIIRKTASSDGMNLEKTNLAVLPGYHQNKEHWNAIILNGTIPVEDVKRMIAECYDLICGRKS